jgi:hypothetical protein
MKSVQKHQKLSYRDYTINISSNVQVSRETQLALEYKLLPFPTGSQDVIALFISY